MLFLRSGALFSEVVTEKNISIFVGMWFVLVLLNGTVTRFVWIMRELTKIMQEEELFMTLCCLR